MQDFFVPHLWMKMLQAGGPVVAAIFLIYVAHDRLRTSCKEATLKDASAQRIRFYDWLYAAFWVFVALLLFGGSIVWIKQQVLDGRALIVRGLFTKVESQVQISTDAGRLYYHRRPSVDFKTEEIDWIFTSIDGEQLPTSATFIITEGDEGRELNVYCKLDFAEAGMSGLGPVEVRYHKKKRFLRIPANDKLFSCTTEEIVSPGAPSFVDFAATGNWFTPAVLAANVEVPPEVIRKALNSPTAVTRHKARLYLRDNYKKYADFVPVLLLDPDASYRERLGAMWTLSRLEPLPREDMFEPGNFSVDIWRACFEAAIEEDEAMRQSGRRFVISYPGEDTLHRLETFGKSLTDPDAVKRYESLMAHYHYNRGVAVLLAEQRDWKGPDVSVALDQIDTAQEILENTGKVPTDEYAKTLFGKSWALAVAAERSPGENFTKDVALSSFKAFLDTKAARSDIYRYPWQKKQAQAYLKSPSLKVFQ